MRILPFLFPVLLVACGGEEAPEPHDHGPGGHTHGESAAHGEAAALGNLTLAGRTFSITRLGDVVPGEEGAFEVALAGDSKGEPMAGLNLFLWVESKEGDQLAAPAKGDVEGDAWHFHTTPRAGSAPHRVVLRLRADGADERAGLPLSGHGHEHAGHGPHDGVVAAFRTGGEEVGHLELKLHDDKGDLELWLARDPRISQPVDLPLDAEVQVVFVDHDDRKVTLAVRDEERNEDEEGTPNIRDGKTNYFIFPGDSGQDASWLQGKDFQSVVRVSFERDGKTYTSEEFVLVPHTHAEGEEDH